MITWITRALWRRFIVTGLVACLLAPCFSEPAWAEAAVVRIGLQYGIAYLPLLIMKHLKLVEAHARRLGVENITTTWKQLGNGVAINEALLSDGLDIASGGVTVFLTIWDKTHGGVKGVAALEALPMYLVTNRPEVRTLADFSDRDKIALVSNKVGTMAVVLQMAAEKLWGPGKHSALDKITVTMRHPEALAAVTSGKTEITSYFGSPPYQDQALENPGVHLVLSSYDVTGGPHIFNMIWAKSAFRAKNPLAYQAFYQALVEAQALIATDPEQAARIYIEEEQVKTSLEQVAAIITRPEIKFTPAPLNIMVFATFMKRIGLLRTAPETWQDLFLPEVHGEPGS